MPDAAESKREARYEDLLDLPENKVGEILMGELHVSPRPASPHARASSALGGSLFGPFDPGGEGPGGWWILFEPELHFGRDVLVPDLAAWRQERMPVIPEAPYFELAPDWVCEVVSPSTARIDRIKKVPIYAREGVRWVWLIDPIARTLEVLERGEGGLYAIAAAHGGEEVVRARPFDAIELPLSRLWLRGDP